jgi:hypothetical protein
MNTVHPLRAAVSILKVIDQAIGPASQSRRRRTAALHACTDTSTATEWPIGLH